MESMKTETCHMAEHCRQNAGEIASKLSRTINQIHQPRCPQIPHQQSQLSLTVYLWGVIPWKTPWETAEKNTKNPRTRTHTSCIVA